MKTITYQEMHDYIKNTIDYEITKHGYYGYRLTKNQRKALQHDAMFEVLSHSSSGAYLLFKTNGNLLKIKFKRTKLSRLLLRAIRKLGFKKLLDMALIARNRIQTYGVKSKLIDHIEIFGANQLLYSKAIKKNKLKLSFDNPQNKDLIIKVYLPMYFPIGIKKIMTNGSLEKVEEKQKTWLALGDSITQGFNANQPTRNYVSLLSRRLNLDVINQGVGGHYFDDNIIEKLDRQIDLITVLYGTNDHEVFGDLSKIKSNINTFFEKLVRVYPTTKIIVITPLWRKDYDENANKDLLNTIRQHITLVIKNYSNIKVVNGLDLIENDDKYYDDGFLHPNTIGFEHMSYQLYEILQNELK